MKFSVKSMAATCLASAGLHVVSAHMMMTSPPPLRSIHNPNNGGNIDYDMTSPLSPSGANYPCKGYLNLLGTPAAKPVATWQAGSSQKLTINGGANHNGGSCQASMSFDGGRTFTVIKSFVGGCPPAGESSWGFTLPVDTPAKTDAIFAWTWFNQVGNREMYMNCAVVTTTAAGGDRQAPAVAFSSRPGIMVANVGNGCSTTEGSDVTFPDPGPDVDNRSSRTGPPVGNCGSRGPSNPPPVVQPPVVEPPVQPPVATPSPTTTLPGGIFIPLPSTTVAAVTPPAGGNGGNGGYPVPPPASSRPTPPATSRPPTPPAPQPTPTPPTPPTPPVTVPDGEDIGAQTVWSPCPREGVFNCVGGTRFQRCGSGLWSPFIPVAPGTRCQPGARDSYIVLLARRRRGRAVVA